MNKTITIETTVNAPLEKVWNFWTGPAHIKQWMHASEDWECPKASNDLRAGSRFSFTFAAEDNSESFDFTGTYTAIEKNKLISYTIDDGRTVSIAFEIVEGGVHVTENFEMENENPEEMQRDGWQSILNNFKNYAEGLSK